MAARDPFALKDLKEYEGARCYHHLIDISQSNRDKVKMEENLVRQVNDAIHMIEDKSGREIELMYIGKTFVDKAVGQPFNRLDPETWIKNGIKARWEDHTSLEKKNKRNADHAKDGLVVLCVFTRDDLPAGSRRSQEFLAIAMEQRLIHHFQIFDARKILINKTFDEGSRSPHTKSFSELSISVYSDNPELDLTRSIPKPNHYAAVIYMTFAFLPPESELREKKANQREKEKCKKEQEKKKKEPEETKGKGHEERDEKQTRKEHASEQKTTEDTLKGFLEEERRKSAQEVYYALPISCGNCIGFSYDSEETAAKPQIEISSTAQSDPPRESITTNLATGIDKIDNEGILGEGPPQDDSKPDDSLLDDTSDNPPLSHKSLDLSQGATHSTHASLKYARRSISSPRERDSESNDHVSSPKQFRIQTYPLHRTSSDSDSGPELTSVAKKSRHKSPPIRPQSTA